LLCDPEHLMINKYGVWQKKKNYGREYMGLIRSTFLIDPNGKVIKEWKNVRAKGHAEKVLKFLKEAQEK
jgi:peroxiredoxin Q/BCP